MARLIAIEVNVFPVALSKLWRYFMGMLRFILLFAFAIFSAEAATRPSVLLICVDDLKPNLGCYGDTIAKSPNIDRLAKRGMMFKSAYCNQAVCAPSRNALLTGMRPTSMGIYDLGTNFRKAVPDAVTMPQFFKQNGYRSEGMGKIFHVGHGNDEDAASWSVPFKKYNVIEYVEKSNTLTREEAYFSNSNLPNEQLPRGAAMERPDVADEAYPDGQMAQEAIRRLRNAKESPETPFFLAVGFVKPHLPFCAPKKYWDMYDRASFNLPELRKGPEGAPAYAPQAGGELKQYKEIPQQWPMPDDLQRELIHGYYAAMSYADAQIGKVLDELDRLGLAEKTYVVLWGDHGWHLGDHGLWCKHTNYEQANRIPVIVAGPDIKAGASNALLESVDIFPTLAELAGLGAPKLPQKMEGSSVAQLLRGKTGKTKDAIFHAYPRNPQRKGNLIGRAVRTERYRLVEWKAPGGADADSIELYDYQTDPAETRNLASEQPDVAKRLLAVLAKEPPARPQWRPAQNK